MSAKYVRIKCHEAINVSARAILLEAKTALEDAERRVIHGIEVPQHVCPRGWLKSSVLRYATFDRRRAPRRCATASAGP